jgi:nucleoside-diphosphate-sugar epimerase
MPDAVRAMLELASAERAHLSSCVYNIGGFSVSAGQVADRVRDAFRDAQVVYEVDPVRAKIIASWPEDVDDSRARTEWGWRPEYDWSGAFDRYLAPAVRARYRARG